jgi:hypothetical protein
MRVRLLVCIAAGIGALVVAGPAVAAYNPTLVVLNRSASSGGTGPVLLSLSSREYRTGDEVTGRVTIYAPNGYSAKLDHAVGAALGTGNVFVLVGGAPAGNQGGTVKVEDPAKHVADSCAPGRHDAVWIFEFSFAGTTVRLPVYVDRVTQGPEAAYASARMLACIPPPQSGVSVLSVDFALRGVFTNPRARGTYAWNAVFIPYAFGMRALNPAGAVQSTSWVRLPLTVAVKTRSRGGLLFVMVCVRVTGQPVGGARVEILTGPPFKNGTRYLAGGPTSRRGCATLAVRPRRKPTRMFATAQTFVRAASGCSGTFAPRCSGASLAAVGPIAHAIKVRR